MLWMDRENPHLCFRLQPRRQPCYLERLSGPGPKNIQLLFQWQQNPPFTVLAHQELGLRERVRLPQSRAAQRNSEPCFGKWEPLSVSHAPGEASDKIMVIIFSCVQAITLPDSLTSFILSLIWWPHPTSTISNSPSSPFHPPHVAISRANSRPFFLIFIYPPKPWSNLP